MTTGGRRRPRRSRDPSRCADLLKLPYSADMVSVLKIVCGRSGSPAEKIYIGLSVVAIHLSR